MNTKAILFGMMCALGMCTGCTHKSSPVHVIGGADTSGSARPYLASYAVSLKKVAGVLTPGVDHLTVFRFDSEAKEVYGPEVPKSLEAFALQLASALQSKPAQRGTTPACFFQLAYEAAMASHEPCVILCLSDGGNDDMTKAGALDLTKLSKSLALISRVKAVVFAGTVPGTREKIRRLMSPLGKKLKFVELDEVALEVRP